MHMRTSNKSNAGKGFFYVFQTAKKKDTEKNQERYTHLKHGLLNKVNSENSFLELLIRGDKQI
jgi:hypothetical protein